MYRDDYRRAMKKLKLSPGVKTSLLAEMEREQARPKGRTIPMRRWALSAVAAVLILAAVPLGLLAMRGGLSTTAYSEQAASVESNGNAAQKDQAGGLPHSSAAVQPAADANGEGQERQDTAEQPPMLGEVGAEPEPALGQWGGVVFSNGVDSMLAGEYSAQAAAPNTSGAAAVQQSGALDEENAVAPVTRKQAISLAEHAGSNPTLDLPGTELPAELPVYTVETAAPGAVRQSIAQLAQALGLEITQWTDGDWPSAQAGSWSLSFTGSGVVVQGEGVLMEKTSDLDGDALAQDYAVRLQSLCPDEEYKWERTVVYNADKTPLATVRLYPTGDGTLENRLYRYCFEALALQLDEQGNVVGLTAGVPDVATQTSQVALRTLADAQAQLHLPDGQQVLHHELVYVYDAGSGTATPAYKFQVMTGEDLNTYFSDGNAAGYAAVQWVYVPAVQKGDGAAPIAGTGAAASNSQDAVKLQPAMGNG